MLQDFDKNKRNLSYPSYTFCNKNPLLCSQFFLCIIIIKTIDKKGNEMSFCNAAIAERNWWGFMMILFRLRDTNTESKHFKVLYKKVI